MFHAFNKARPLAANLCCYGILNLNRLIAFLDMEERVLHLFWLSRFLSLKFIEKFDTSKNGLRG
jgi:hypothetical protein